MRSKKLISLLCAAALTASSFASLTITASAASTPVFSYTGDSTDGWTAVGTMGVKTDDDGDKYIEFESQGSNAKGKILELPTAAQLTDDYVVDFDVNLEAGDGMGRLNQYTQIAFSGGTSTQDTQTYGGDYATAANSVNPDTEHAFATEPGSGSLQGEGYVGDMAVSLISRTELLGKWIVNYDGTNAPNFATDGDVQVGENKWVRVRAAVSGGKANITIADGEKKLLEKQYDASATQLKDIRINLGRADINLFTASQKASVKLDNINIYSGVANAPAFTTEGLRGYVAPTPIPAKVAAPGLTAPDGVEVKLSEDFNSLAKINQALDSTDTTTAVGTGINVSMKSRNGGDGSTYVSVADYVTGDKVMTLSSGKFGHAGRGPVATLADNLATDVTNGKVAVMAFAVRISKTATDGAGRLYFIKDNTQSGNDGTGAYRNVAAVLTTVEDETIYRGDDSASDVISTYVTPDVWHTVTFVVAGDGYHRVYVDGAREASLKLQYVATGENASSMTALPSITAVSKAAKVNKVDVGSDYSMVQVDNLLAYSSSETDLKKVLPTEVEPPKPPVSVSATYTGDTTGNGTLTVTPTEPTTAVVIKVSADNTDAKIIKEYKGNELLADTAELEVTDVTVGDKFFVWDSLAGMKPLLATPVVATQGAAATYKVSVVADATKGTAKADKTEKLNKDDEVTITATPADGYEIDKITAKDATGAGVAVTNGKFKMPESNVTVTVTFKAKSYNVTLPTDTTKGAVKSDKATAAKGDTVTLTVKPAEDYNYKAGSLKVMNGTTPVDTKAGTDANTFTFTMPAANVAVTAEFEAKTYAVTIAQTENGTVTAAPTTAAKGATVTLTVEPATGYKLSTLEVANGTEKLTTTKVDDTHYTFTMPAAAVTVTAAFVAATVEEPKITGTVAITGTAKVGETLTATVTGLNDGKSAAYQWQANTGAEGAYVAIENATDSTFKVPKDLVGKTIKVVVTAVGTKGSIESAATAAVAAKTYAITTQEGVAANLTEAAKDATVTLTVTLPDAEKVATVKATYGTENTELTVTPVEGEANKYTFKMPAAAVNVTVTFADAKYTVTGTLGAGVESAVLRPQGATDATTDVAGKPDTADNTKVTFNVVAGKYTVVATAATGYKNAGATPAEVTVNKDAKTGSFTTYATKVLSVTGTVDAGVKSVILHPTTAADDVHTGDIEGAIDGTAVTFADVAAGTYKIEATANAGYDAPVIKLGDEVATKVEVTTDSVTNLSVTAAESVIPYAEGTITYDGESAAASFVDYSRVTSSVAAGANSNATKAQDLKTGSGGQSGAGYNPFTETYPANGDAVKVSFDITIPVRNAWVSVRGTKPGTGNRDNAATKRIFTIGAEGSGIVKIYSGADVVDEIAGTDIVTKWYHVDAVVNNTAKTTAIKVYNYKANNNYINETALYDKTVDFRDSSVAGVVAMDYYSNITNANLQIDNLYINDSSYVAPNTVTVTAPATADGTLAASATQAKAGDVITVTATAKAGKKLTAVKANDTVLSAGDDGKYTYTMPDPAVDVTISATFARADVTAIEISGDATVAVVDGTANYTAVAKAGETTVDGTITWSMAPAAEGGATIADGTSINESSGVLTLAGAQGEGKIVITASTKKDITSDSTEAANTVTATKEVTIVTEPVYALATQATTGGSVALKVNGAAATQLKQSETLTIVPTAADGYVLDKVYYILTENAATAEDSAWTEVTKTGEAYTVAGSDLTGDITVKATFTAIDYTITNNNSDADASGNKLEIDKTTANIGDTVTITPTIIGENTKMTLSVKSDDNEIAVTAGESTYTFVMPAGNVVISAQFVTTKDIDLAADKISGTYFDFRSDNADTSYIETNAGSLKVGQLKLADGKLTASNTAYEDTSVGMVISIDASEYVGKIYGAKITYDFKAGSYNSWINYAGKFANYIDLTAEDAKVTGNNVNELGGTATNVYTFAAWAYGSTKNSTVTQTMPIDDLFVKDDDGKVSMYMYLGTGRLQTIENVKISLTVVDEGV